MRWFGESWGAPVCVTGEHVATPVGSRCEHCAQLFEADDQGLILPAFIEGTAEDWPIHRDCLLRAIEG
jgi:hypothetical protein